MHDVFVSLQAVPGNVIPVLSVRRIPDAYCVPAEGEPSNPRMTPAGHTRSADGTHPVRQGCRQKG